MSVIINPGSGPVPNATSVQALANAQIFAREVDATKVEGPLGTDGDGRWKFRLSKDGRTVEIEMPGTPLDKVHYVDENQNIWDFPRLYVDGSSWVWLYARNAARSVLSGKDEDEE